MKLHHRGLMILLALLAALLIGCAPDESVVNCHSDLVSRPDENPGLTITYSGENLEMQVIAPDGTTVQPATTSAITVDSGPATLAELGTPDTGTYLIHMRDTTGNRGDFIFEAIVAERQVTRVRLICN
jgi:hypothetical protein